MSLQIVPFDPKTVSEDVMRAFHVHWTDYERETLPDDPDEPFAQFRNFWSNYPDEWLTRGFLGLEDDRIVASVGAHLGTVDNVDKGWGWVYVSPDQRGKGLARRLMTPLADFLVEDGRRLFAVGIPEGFETAALAERAGMKPALRMKRSRLRIDELDLKLMQAWIDRAADRASDYEILSWKSPIPEEHLEAFCALTDIMNTAPMEDYEEDPEHATPQLWREIEQSLAKGSEEMLLCVARHKPTGAFAGYTNIKYQGLHPVLAWQWDTGVDPAHRNKGLGRWLKGSMAKRMVEAYPKIQYIDTFNAGSNEPMLNINIEMGYKPLLTRVNWQGETAVMRERLGV